jgi:threonine dehydratase
MQCVAAPPAEEFVRSVSERGGLNAVRHLAARFPTARLREVPLVRAPELDVRADPTAATRVWLALEALQVTGSFKVRGALVSLAANAARGHVVAASAGNHGAGVAYAARVLGMSATVCVPRNVAQMKRARIEKYGAELVVASSNRYEDAENLARQIAASRGLVFISPYDDNNVVLGNGASLGFEIVRALGGVPDRVLAPFGGGGLATGLSWAFAAEARESGERVVWGVQSQASCAMAMAMARGGPVPRVGSAPETLAEGLVGGVSPKAFDRAAAAIAGVIVTTETQIAAAMVYAYRDMGLLIEGSAAAALAPVLFGLPQPVRGGDLVVVLTGRNVDPARLETVLAGTGEADDLW